MPVPDEIGSKPPVGIVFISLFWDAGTASIGSSSFHDAFLALKGGCPFTQTLADFAFPLAYPFGGSSADVNANCTKIGLEEPGGSISVDQAEYFIAGFSATCFLKVWWSEIVRDFTTEEIISEVEKDFTFEFTTHAGFCLPEGFTDGDAIASNPINLLNFTEIRDVWDKSEIYLMEAPEPPTPTEAPDYTTRHIKRIEKVRWSALEDYEPPEDGSANGFPAVA